MDGQTDGRVDRQKRGVESHSTRQKIGWCDVHPHLPPFPTCHSCHSLRKRQLFITLSQRGSYSLLYPQMKHMDRHIVDENKAGYTISSQSDNAKNVTDGRIDGPTYRSTECVLATKTRCYRRQAAVKLMFETTVGNKITNQWQNQKSDVKSAN